MGSTDHSSTVDRRQLLGAGALAAVAIGAPLTIWHRIAAGERGSATDRQRLILADVVQRVIPRTETAGAADVGTHDFVILALDHGLDGTRRPAASAAITGADARYRREDGSINQLFWLEDELDGAARGDYLAAPQGARGQALARIDTAAYAPNAPDSAWKALKGLILTGYYTSEVGASKELQYDLVPGRFDPDLPLDPNNRAWSSDWTAVDFG